MPGLFRSLLALAGKGERKVAAVFGSAPADCDRAVAHLRAGAPDIPVWLFSTEEPSPETAALCERVVVASNSLALLLRAERQLWPRWVAISAGAWTGRPGKWPLKLAPFLVPPFRALLLNRHGDFFAGTPGWVLRHGARTVRDTLDSSWHAALEKISWALSCCLLSAGGVILRHSPRRWIDGLCAAGEPVPREHWGGGGVALFRNPGLRWDGPALERFARATDARWILWLDPSDRAARTNTGELLPLFSDERTFAISRQRGFRAWKHELFPTAPFRTLQPGETTQVLAPLSSSILVDRRKLLAVGIPHCLVPGAAWALIFWKAAAADWRCYSVGGRASAELEEEPDAPLQEAEVLFHFLRHRALRRQRPAEADLARGTIAFAPALQPAAARTAALAPHRLRILLVSPFLPYPLSHGGAVRIYNLCRALVDRIDFLLVAIREKNEFVDYPKLHEVFREVHIVDIDERLSGDKSLPRQVRGHESRSLRALIAELARTRRPNLLQIEYTHMAAFRDAAPELPAILVEHDLTFSLYRQLAEAKPQGREEREEYERWLRFERGWLKNFDVVWTVSDADCATAIRESGRPPESTYTIPNGVDIERFTPSEQTASSPEIFYVGSFRHLPNILGFQKLCDEVMPRVWERMPEARLRVVAGPRHLDFADGLTGKAAPADLDPRIEIHGFVEDLRPLYARASVVAVPLEVSAGTNIKVLEAMACAKAVVSTPIGCAGLDLADGSDVLIRADWEAFAGAIYDLLADDALRARIASKARRTAESRFSWDAIASQAYACYATLTDRRAAAD